MMRGSFINTTTQGSLVMLNEKFVESIAGTAVKAAGASILPNGDRAGFLIQNGTAQAIDIPPAARDHLVLTLGDIETAVENWEAETVFHDEDCVKVVIDDADRRDTVTMRLNKSKPFMELVALTKPRELTQRDFIRLLRTTFRGCYSDTDLSAIRSINFDSQAQGESYIAPGTEKIGKSIAAKVVMKDGGSVPEELRLVVPVYTNTGLTKALPTVLVLDVDVHKQTFSIQSPPGEWESLINAMVEEIHEKLAASLASTTVLRGTL